MTTKHDLRQARADWVRTFRWDFWITLTYAVRIVEVAAAAQFRSWCQLAAARVFQSHLRIAYATDLQARGVVHYHVLLAVLDEGGPSFRVHELSGLLRGIWWEKDARADLIAVRRYKPEGRGSGAAWYQAKHDKDWDIGTVCSRARRCRRRCRYGRTAL